jgi:hypothetical protein
LEKGIAMRLLQSFLAVGLLLAWTVHTEAAAPVNGKKKHHHHHVVHGIVVAAEKDKDKDSGSITVRVHHKNGKSGKPETSLKTFRVDSATKFEKVLHFAKGQEKREPSSFKEVHKGEHVAIVPEGGKHHEAKLVMINVHHHKKGKGPGK